MTGTGVRSAAAEPLPIGEARLQQALRAWLAGEGRAGEALPKVALGASGRFAAEHGRRDQGNAGRGVNRCDVKARRDPSSGASRHLLPQGEKGAE